MADRDDGSPNKPFQTEIVPGTAGSGRLFDETADDVRTGRVPGNDVASDDARRTTTGRLLALQGRAALAQIVRRTTESWGARSTVTRAAQRIVRSCVGWGVLAETGERGIFAPAPKIAVHDAATAAWLEAGIAASGRREYPLRSLAGAPSCYPLDLRLSARRVTRQATPLPRATHH